MTSLYTRNTKDFREGYSDKFHGKDNREKYSGPRLKEYIKGRKQCERETGLDIMFELNG